MTVRVCARCGRGGVLNSTDGPVAAALLWCAGQSHREPPRVVLAYKLPPPNESPTNG